MPRRLRQAFNRLDLSKKDKEFFIPAILGFMINGVKTVEVAERPGYVYVRIRSNLNEVVQAFNDKVSPVYDLPVLLIRDPNNVTRYRVDSRDTARYENWGSTSSYLPRHGNQHSFNPDGGGGGDIVWVYGRQFMPLALSPSGTNGAANILLNGYTYYQNFEWKYAGGTGTASLLPYKPTGSNARMVLVYLDDDGNPSLLPGTDYFAANITGTSDIIPYLPLVPTTTSIPIGAVRLVSGTSTIMWENIYDLRPMIVGDGFVPTGTFGHTIEDDGTPLANRSSLNFVGDGFVVYDSGSKTNVSGTASVGADRNTTDVKIYDDSVFKVTGSSISFDANLSVVVSGSVAFISSTASSGTTGPPGSNVIVFYENNVFKVSGSSVAFNDASLLLVSGSSIFVERPSWKQRVWEDDFQGGAAVSAEIGALGWTLGAGTATKVSALTYKKHPGIYRVNSQSNGMGRFTLGSDAALAFNDMEYMGWLVAGNNNLVAGGITGAYRVGVINNINSIRDAAEGLYFIYDSLITGSWCLVEDYVGGSQIITSLQVAYAQDSWMLFEAKRTGNQFQIFVNNTYKMTTTTFPSAYDTEHYIVASAEKYGPGGTTVGLNVDWFGFRTISQQPWT